MSTRRDRIHALRVAGQITKGLVYVLVGALTAGAAFGLGGEVSGTRSVAATLARLPAGSLLVVSAALGLGAYALWRLYEAFTDTPGATEESATSRLVSRAYGVASALAYGASGLAFGGVVVDAGGESSGGKTLIAEALDHPAGPYAIGAFGLVLFGVALSQFRHAATADFMDKLDARPSQRGAYAVVERLGRFGYAARGVVGAISSYFVYRVVDAYSASEYAGTEEVFYWLLRQERGDLLMGLVALGMASYGVFYLAVAHYSRRWGVARRADE